MERLASPRQEVAKVKGMGGASDSCCATVLGKDAEHPLLTLRPGIAGPNCDGVKQVVGTNADLNTHEREVGESPWRRGRLAALKESKRRIENHLNGAVVGRSFTSIGLDVFRVGRRGLRAAVWDCQERACVLPIRLHGTDLIFVF